MSTPDAAWLEAMRRSSWEAIPDGLAGRWWVAHTRPRSEKALARELGKFSIIYYLPLARRTTRSPRTGRTSRSIVPVFPGYLFFNGTDEQRQQALTTNRIVNTLHVFAQEELVGQLRQVQKVLAAEAGFEWCPSLKAGDWARVVEGPLAGLEGVVCQHLSRMRLALNVRMLSQSVIVEVAYDVLERMDAPPFAAGT